MRKQSFRVLSFGEDVLLEEIQKASCAPTGTDAFFQSKYLASYLSNMESGAHTLIVETPYVDRYFLEEYTHYYSTTLHPPKPKATRFHFFKNRFDKDDLDIFLNEAATGYYPEVCERLSSNYLGFTVVRPLPCAPIGRTILATFKSDNQDRCFALPPSPYTVHLAGLKLSVTGIPFQQQEQAVGACATTAIWSALSRIVRTDGGRAPTPFAVTEAATKNVIWDRAFPAASGLKDEQVIEAIRHFGYSPLLVEPKDEAEMFALVLKCYVRSGIPVILKIYEKDNVVEAHDVTVVGFSEFDSDREEDLITLNFLKSRRIRRIYVHDDRLGPYARAEIVSHGKDLWMKYAPNKKGFEDFAKDMAIWHAIVPLYPKLRLTALNLIEIANGLLPIINAVVGVKSTRDVRFNSYFTLSGDYLRDFFLSGFPTHKKKALATTCVLSRYIGIIEFSIGDSVIFHVICDTTDIKRDVPRNSQLIAMISRFDEDVPKLEDYRNDYAPDALVL